MKKCILFFLLGAFLPYMVIRGQLDPINVARKNNQPTVVFFTKQRCPYCVWLKPRFNQLQKDFNSNFVQFYTIDIGGSEYYKRKYKIQTVPTVIYFDAHGNEKVRHGSNNKNIKLSQMQLYVERILLS